MQLELIRKSIIKQELTMHRNGHFHSTKIMQLRRDRFIKSTSRSMTYNFIRHTKFKIGLTSSLITLVH